MSDKKNKKSETVNHVFNDVHNLSSTRTITDEGFLQTDARMSQVGIANYRAGEFDNFESFGAKSANDIIRVFRPEDTLFNDKTLKSFANKPVTDNHPSSASVTPKNAKREMVGTIGDSVTRDGNSMRARLTITDETAINQIQSGKVGLSIGYQGSIVPQKGVTDSGEEFDAVLTKMVGNHVALTNNPRAGINCRLLDENQKPKGAKSMETVNISGIDVEVSKQAKQALTKITDSNSKLETQVKTLNDELSSLKKEKEALSGELDVMKEQINDTESFDKAVMARVAMIDSVKPLIPEFQFSGKTDREVNEAVIKKLNDSFDCSEKSDEYLQARVDTLLDMKKLEGKADKYGTKRLNDSQKELSSNTQPMSLMQKARMERLAKDKMNQRNNKVRGA